MFNLEPASTGGGNGVHARASVLLGWLHFGSHVTCQLQSVECRVQRTLTGIEAIARHLTDSVGDAPPVVRTEREDPEDQEVERPL